MTRRPSALVTPEQTRQDASAAIARAQLPAIERDRPKRIDQFIDYFGSGGNRRPFPEAQEGYFEERPVFPGATPSVGGLGEPVAGPPM